MEDDIQRFLKISDALIAHLQGRGPLTKRELLLIRSTTVRIRSLITILSSERLLDGQPSPPSDLTEPPSPRSSG